MRFTLRCADSLLPTNMQNKHTEPVTVRTATLEDVDYMVDLHRKNSDALGFVPRQGYVTAIDGTYHAGVWLAEVNGQAVGFLYAGPGKSVGGVATIHQACIQHDARRLEYGEALVQAFEQWAVELQRSGAQLGVGTDLESRQFWQALSYDTVRVETRGQRRKRQVEVRYKELESGLWVPRCEIDNV